MRKTSLFLVLFISLAICACENPIIAGLLEPKTIIFNSNGGSHVSSQTLLKNEKVIEPLSPVKEGQIFNGWFLDNDSFSNKWDFNNIPKSDMTLYAKWNDKPTPKEEDFIINGAGDVEYDGNPKVVTITPYPGKSNGKITIYYIDMYNSITQTAPTNPGAYLVTFDVAAYEDWNAADGLTAGTLTINMSVKVNLTPDASDFYIGGASTFTYDGNSKTVSIEPKTGKSQGTVTVYYNGKTSPPVNIGTYTVTFDVALADGWYAANGLSAGTLTIIAVNPNYQTPVAGDYTFEGNGTFTYDGSARAVTVTPKTGKSQGTVIIKYNGSITPPANTATYTVTFDVAVANGWNSASGLSAGTLTISKATPEAEDYNIEGLGSFSYDGEAKAVTVTPMNGKSPGIRTVHYQKDTTKTETSPSNVGTYIVTFDVAADINWNEVHGLFAGFFTINKGTLTASNYDISELAQTYNGVAKNASIKPKTDKIPAVSKIYYNGSINVPVNAGNYPVTFDVAEDGNWNPANGLSAGMLTVNKATPVVGDFIISNNLTQNIPYPSINSISAVNISTITDKSQGARTVYYEGINGTTYTQNTVKPSNIGSYKVTFDVAESTDRNWNAATGLYAGILEINVFKSIDDLGKWLKEQSEDNITNPYPVALKVSDLGGTATTNGSTGAMLLANSNKYVSLDLSGSTINNIGDSAFYNIDNLVSIIIPNSVIIIGESAFHSCDSLTGITIGNNVTSIGKEAFSGCTSLKNITIPDKVTSIGNGAFSECDGLFNVMFKGTIPSSGFSTDNPFLGDLREVFYATDKNNGTPGTYTREDESKPWILQQ